MGQKDRYRKSSTEHVPEQQSDSAASESSQQKPSRVVFQEYAEAFVVAVILAIIIRAFFVQAFKIPSGSMEPTLLVGDHILVCKFIYGVRIPFTNERFPQFTSPSRGDVIVFIYPEDRSKDFIKRVVAVGGDTIAIKEKAVYVNGERITEEHAFHRDEGFQPGRDFMEPQTVPDGYLFVMGDNRDFSHDSRFWGFVNELDVRGQAFMIYYSADFRKNVHAYANRPPEERVKTGFRWGRFFKVIR